jgi:hypothetical protein
MFNGNGKSNDDDLLTNETLRDKIKKFPTNQEFKK